MIIEGAHVRLRDRRLDDFADYARWFSPGRDWQKWDAPWEKVKAFNSGTRRRWESQLSEPRVNPRVFLEIETRVGRHIGWVNSYWIDEQSRWRDCGIAIAESDAWGQGLGREAYALWIGYQMEAFDLPRIGMGTWSGNERMMMYVAAPRWPAALCSLGLGWCCRVDSTTVQHPSDPSGHRENECGRSSGYCVRLAAAA